MWNLLRPLLFRLEAERAHHLTMRLYCAGLAVPGARSLLAPSARMLPGALHCERFGLAFPSPVGLAAGFDKDARWFNELALLGFGFIEVGTLTAHPQAGNPRPRLFRLPADRALLNRFGFNNEGSEAAARALAAREIQPLLGINIGKSKITPNEEAVEDYLASLERLHPFASYVAINVSSPNTAGLRDLQARAPLEALLRALRDRSRALDTAAGGRRRPLLVKIAPDLDEASLEDVVGIVKDLQLDGIIATNTTISREELATSARRLEALGAGGISGAPLTQRSRQMVARIRVLAGPELPIIGVGGIMNGDDAWEMLRAGASLVQVYTGLIYGGPRFVHNLHGTLEARVAERGLGSIDEIVGENAAALA